MKGLYIHIPFCEYICHYCDFVKRVPKNKDMIDTYIDHLIEELKSYETHFKDIDTIYIGGGTPSVLTDLQLRRIVKVIQVIKPLEFSIEVNPESYTKAKGLLYQSLGITRVSLGVQTFNQTHLKYLNRGHSNQQVIDAVDHLKSIGMDVSIDLIYAFPKQTLKDLSYDLNMVKDLDIEHVSCYSLILEEKTVFYHEYLKGNFEMVSEDLEAQMYQKVIETLKSYGYEHYEISNFAKHKKYSKHNMIYWTLDSYIGCGLGAHGFVDGYRTQNERHLDRYYKNPLKEKVYQDQATLLQDALIFGLRKINGISIEEIEKTYEINLLETYPQLKEKIALELVEIEDGYLKLTEKGRFLGNQVFMVFI